MLNWLKWKIAPREMAALQRYRVACDEAQRWLAANPGLAETAAWIQGKGEDSDPRSISRLRGHVEMVKALADA